MSIRRVCPSMTEELRIDSNERRRLTTGRDFNPPKYTFYALDAAIKYSGANKKETVGDIGEIYTEFEQEHPSGDFEDWKRFYYQNYGGEERIEEATERGHQMFLKLRESIEQIERSDIRQFIEGLVLTGTYEGQNPREAIVRKLIKDTSFECKFADDAAEDEVVHFICEGQPVSLQTASNVSDEVSPERDDLIVVNYEERQNGTIVVDLSNLNRRLDDF